MGALTTNRKRGNDFLNLSYFSSPYSTTTTTTTSNSISEYDFHQVSKKPRVSSSYVNLSPETSHVSPPVVLKSSVSRIHRYPEPTQRFRREVHAPCRKHKFFGSVNLSVETPPRSENLSVEETPRSDDMGNFLNRQYEQTKSIAFETLQNFRKYKALVEAQSSKDVISDDSSVEELEILENVDNGREDGPSVVSEQRSLETHGDAYLQEKYAKFADYHPGASSSGATDLVNRRPEVDDTDKMLESLSVSRVLKEMGVPPHKKLYESAERRNSKLGFLAFQIDLATKKLSFLPKPSKKPEEEVTFTPLTEEEEEEVSIALSNANRRRVLATHENSNIQITGEIMQCLRPGAWLNDEAINVYLELLKERENREPKKFLKCHFFNTFFYKKLISGKGGYDFKAVRRWTTQRKIGYGLIECDKIFVPIHKEIHWCLAVINKKEEKFQYLDSLKGMDSKVLKVLAKYFVEEVKDKSGKEIDVSSWKHEYVDDLPEQKNGWDCGVFMIKYADFYSRGLGLSFNQEHMPYFRRRTAKEILRLKAE